MYERKFDLLAKAFAMNGIIKIEPGVRLEKCFAFTNSKYVFKFIDRYNKRKEISE